MSYFEAKIHQRFPDPLAGFKGAAKQTFARAAKTLAPPLFVRKLSVDGFAPNLA